MTLNNLAVLYMSRGQYAAAEPLYQRALAMFEPCLGPTHPKVVTCRQNYAQLLPETQPQDEAVALEAWERPPAAHASLSPRPGPTSAWSGAPRCPPRPLVPCARWPRTGLAARWQACCQPRCSWVAGGPGSCYRASPSTR